MVNDLVIIGSGPSSLTASIYSSREGIDTTIYEKSTIGGLAAMTDKIDNYPGFPDGITGFQLADNLKKQALRFGTKILFGEVQSITDCKQYKKIIVDNIEVQSKAVLIATGTNRKKLGIPGEIENYGRGVSYCATCDGAFYKDKKIVVIGGGNAGFQEAIFLTRFASHIDVLARSKVRASQSIRDNIQKYVSNGQVTIHEDNIIKQILSDDKITGVSCLENGVEKIYSAEGVFIFVGLEPNTIFLKSSSIKLDKRNFVVTDDNMETSMNGVFASGDVRSGSTMQIATAVGDGAAAALCISRYLSKTI
jgi:thioredoxin reductase (NADPH)